jgi:hypothetical protein
MDLLFEVEIKKPYSGPKLTVYGTIEDIKKKALAQFPSSRPAVECDILPRRPGSHEAAQPL